VRNRRGRRIAVRVVEQAHRDRLDRVAVEAVDVDVDAVGVRARHVERLDAADAAEAVLRGAGVERVFAQQPGALQQAEARRWHDQVQEPGHAADRAVAFDRIDARRRVDLEAHAPAMTAASMHGERSHACGST
jgi:hypothetical protein